MGKIKEETEVVEEIVEKEEVKEQAKVEDQKTEENKEKNSEEKVFAQAEFFEPATYSDLLFGEAIAPFDEISEEFDIKDNGQVNFKGSPSQITQMLEDYAKYFGEITNPWNTMTNAFLKNKYAPLNEVLNTIRPVLARNGFSVIQIPKVDEKNDVLIQTMLMHKAGAMISFPSLKAKAVKSDIQGLGAAITYLRRFSISSILGIASENDDDGESNKEKKGKTATKAKESKLTPEQSKARTELIKLCTELTAKDEKNKPKILAKTGDINSLKTVKEFESAFKAVKELGL